MVDQTERTIGATLRGSVPYVQTPEVDLELPEITSDEDDILTKVSEKFELRYIEQIEETQKAIENSDPFNLITKSNNDFGFFFICLYGD